MTKQTGRRLKNSTNRISRKLNRNEWVTEMNILIFHWEKSYYILKYHGSFRIYKYTIYVVHPF